MRARAGEVLVQIGDDSHHVGQGGAGVEEASSSAVDQYVIQVLGVDPGGERDDHGAQQFALPCAGGARQEAMGPIGDQVDLQGAVCR